MADLTVAVALSHQKAPHQTGYSRRDPAQKSLQLIARKYDPNQPRDEQGQWTKTTGRTFTSDEGYEFHEKGPVVDWVKSLPVADVYALENYGGFGYTDINNLRRGTYVTPIIDEFVREATPEEMRRIGWDPDKGEWIKAVEVSPGTFKPGHPVDPRDVITPEYIARFGYPMGRHEAKDYDPDDPYHQVAEGRIIVNQFYQPVEGGPKVMFSIRRPVPDAKRLADVEQRAAQLDELIAQRGYELPEAIVVQRGAYLPGVSFEQLQDMAYPGPNGEPPLVWEEKGFTSTMVGDAKGRAKTYPALGKIESISRRFPNDKIREHQDEVGSAVRFHITLPKGTKIASIEAARRVDHEFPRIPNPEPIPDDPFWKAHPDLWTVENRQAQPTVKTKRLDTKEDRIESEALLGSGARFQITKVVPGETISTGDPALKPIPIIDVHMEYIGGGSSMGRRRG